MKIIREQALSLLEKNRMWFHSREITPGDRLKDDVFLIAALQEGDKDAFEKMDRRYRPKIRHYLSRHLTCPDQIEELTQLTLIRAFRYIKTLDDPKKLTVWLFRIALRLCIDESRKRRLLSLDSYRQNGSDSETDENSQTTDISTQENKRFFVRDDDPAQIAEQLEERQNVWEQAKIILSDDEFHVLWARYVEEQDSKVIAVAMRRSHVSVRVLLHRGRQKLREHFQKNEDEPVIDSSIRSEKNKKLKNS